MMRFTSTRILQSNICFVRDPIEILCNCMKERKKSLHQGEIYEWSGSSKRCENKKGSGEIDNSQVV
jgi:hypothetical protein